MVRRWAVVIAACCGCAVLADGAPNSVTLEVTVRSMADSTPIRGAELVVERVIRGTASTLSEDVDDNVITRAESNERGEIKLDELPLVPMRLKLRAEGYVSPAIDDLKNARLRHRIELLLPRAIDVRGMVVDETGKPVPSVQVDLSSAVDKSGRLFRLAESLSVTTDASGAFFIKRAPEGQGRFGVAAKGYSLLSEEATRELSGKPIRLTIRRGGILRVEIDAPLHLRGQYCIKVQRQDDTGKLSVVQEKPGADRGPVTFIDVPAGKYVVLAEINTRRGPEMPLTGSVEVGVGQTADVQVTSKK